jgi:hypothetical protein
MLLERSNKRARHAARTVETKHAYNITVWKLILVLYETENLKAREAELQQRH